MVRDAGADENSWATPKPKSGYAKDAPNQKTIALATKRLEDDGRVTLQTPDAPTLHCSNCQAELDVAKAVKKLYCEKCDEAKDEGDLTTKYECSSCGSEYTRENSADGDSNRCPDCNKFGALQHENVCDGCEEEVLEVDIVECPDCGTFTTVEKAKEVKVDPAMPKVETVKFPYKKGQHFKLKAPYEHIDLFRPEYKYTIGKYPTVLTLHSIDKSERLGIRLGNTDVQRMEEDNAFRGSTLVPMTFKEILDNWIPISYQEVRDFVVANRKCENCWKMGADYCYSVLMVFGNPLLPSGELNAGNRFLCAECKAKSKSITEPIFEASSEARRKAYNERLQKTGVVCEPCKAKYPNQSIEFFTFLPDEFKKHSKTHREKKKAT